MKKIGIFGGTFDPVHNGHTGLAEDAMEIMSLDKVIFIPAKLQPFKMDVRTAAGKDRVEMLRLALNGYRGFEISAYEMYSDSISYTYLTMREMKELYGREAQLYFITGTDTFLKIERWKNSEELLTSYSYIIGTRPGYKEDELQECIERITRLYGTDVTNISNRQQDISSTDIRNMLKSGADTNGLIHSSVERYIKINGLYR